MPSHDNQQAVRGKFQTADASLKLLENELDTVVKESEAHLKTRQDAHDLTTREREEELTLRCGERDELLKTRKSKEVEHDTKIANAEGMLVAAESTAVEQSREFGGFRRGVTKESDIENVREKSREQAAADLKLRFGLGHDPKIWKIGSWIVTVFHVLFVTISLSILYKGIFLAGQEVHVVWVTLVGALAGALVAASVIQFALRYVWNLLGRRAALTAHGEPLGTALLCFAVVLSLIIFCGAGTLDGKSLHDLAAARAIGHAALATPWFAAVVMGMIMGGLYSIMASAAGFWEGYRNEAVKRCDGYIKEKFEEDLERKRGRSAREAHADRHAAVRSVSECYQAEQALEVTKADRTKELAKLDEIIKQKNDEIEHLRIKLAECRERRPEGRDGYLPADRSRVEALETRIAHVRLQRDSLLSVLINEPNVNPGVNIL